LKTNFLKWKKKFKKKSSKFKNSLATCYKGVVIVKINKKFQNTTFRYFSIPYLYFSEVVLKVINFFKNHQSEIKNF